MTPTGSARLLTPPPRLDPLGLLPRLLPMSSREVGAFAYPFLRGALRGEEDLTTRHILDLCGWTLRLREDKM